VRIGGRERRLLLTEPTSIRSSADSRSQPRAADRFLGDLAALAMRLEHPPVGAAAALSDPTPRWFLQLDVDEPLRDAIAPHLPGLTASRRSRRCPARRDPLRNCLSYDSIPCQSPTVRVLARLASADDPRADPGGWGIGRRAPDARRGRPPDPTGARPRRCLDEAAQRVATLPETEIEPDCASDTGFTLLTMAVRLAVQRQQHGDRGDYGPWRERQVELQPAATGSIARISGHNIGRSPSTRGTIVDFDFNNEVFNSSVEHAESRLVRRLFKLGRFDPWRQAGRRRARGRR
jgi:hypothetical protein